MDLTIWLNAIAEPKNRKIVVATLEFLDQVEKLSYRNGKTSIEISRDFKLDTEIITFPMRSFSPFYEVFNDRLRRLVEAGICPHRLAGSVLSPKLKNKRYDEEIPALVLSMDDLGVGFEVCLIELAFSALTFVCEIAYPRLKEYLVILHAIFVFFKICKPTI